MNINEFIASAKFLAEHCNKTIRCSDYDDPNSCTNVHAEEHLCEYCGIRNNLNGCDGKGNIKDTDPSMHKLNGYIIYEFTKEI
ncbi:MAG: hypothetical protein M0P71_15060 [Melioribacteraceae bacterium]|jgi:hypothetical protein|nr:hypothetical protein [Melioribacteraceae bacterium]